jgi:hypothetical protein
MSESARLAPCYGLLISWARKHAPKRNMTTMPSRSILLRALALTALLFAAAASAADARARTGKYVGKTSQNLKVTLSVHNRGTRVDFSIPFAKETDCTGNSTFVEGNTDLGKNVRLKRDGTFKFTYSSQADVTINGQPGATDHYTYTVTGKFKRDVVTGTLYERDDIFDSANRPYGSCQTKGVTYKGKRRT